MSAALLARRVLRLDDHQVRELELLLGLHVTHAHAPEVRADLVGGVTFVNGVSAFAITFVLWSFGVL